MSIAVDCSVILMDCKIWPSGVNSSMMLFFVTGDLRTTVMLLAAGFGLIWTSELISFFFYIAYLFQSDLFLLQWWMMKNGLARWVGRMVTFNLKVEN